MNNLVFLGAAFTMLILISQSHFILAYRDPQHCQGYNACYTIGYSDGYNDAHNGISPAYACVGHSENWCAGYNDGFRAGNGGNNIFYGQRSDQTSNINVRGDNNKIIVNQQSDNQMGFTSGHKSSDGFTELCDLVFEFGYQNQVNHAHFYSFCPEYWGQKISPQFAIDGLKNHRFPDMALV